MPILATTKYIFTIYIPVSGHYNNSVFEPLPVISPLSCCNDATLVT